MLKTKLECESMRAVDFFKNIIVGLFLTLAFGVDAHIYLFFCFFIGFCSRHMLNKQTLMMLRFRKVSNSYSNATHGFRLIYLKCNYG